MKLCVVSESYQGPNPDEHINDDTITIQTYPAETNMSHEPRTEGWCGTTNDWSVEAHGVYDTREAAEAAIAEIFGEVREADDLDDETLHNDDIIVVYHPGQYPRMTGEESVDWCYDNYTDGGIVVADTTDAQIDDIVADYAAEAIEVMGAALDVRAVRGAMVEYRDGLRGERA